MRKNWKSYLFLVTVIFFALGFVNIVFALIGFVCLLLPFVLLLKDGKKTWCQQYCPRASSFTVLTKGRSCTGKTGPGWLIRGNGKWYLLAYFAINFFMITMSTIRVSKGLMYPVEQVRFLIAFPLPFDLPQVLNLWQFQDWILHLSYRIYSMMFTSTVIGLLLGFLYRPRTWCTVCPISTLSNVFLKRKGRKAKGNISLN